MSVANPSQAVGEALRFHQRGELAEAQRRYRAILNADHRQADALYLMGVVRMQQARYAEAAEFLGSAIAARPDYAEAHSALGGVMNALTRCDAAVASCRRALELNPQLADAHNNLGNALRGLRQESDAVASYERAAALNPGLAEAHYNLGGALHALGRQVDAIASYRKALQARPRYAEAYSNMGNAQADLGRHEEAAASYRSALAVRPDFAEAHYNLGRAYGALGRHAEAVASYRQALALRPDYPEAHSNLAASLNELQCYDEALASARQALALNPNHAEAHNNLAVVLNALKHHEESAASCRRALALRPRFAEAQVNLGIALEDQGLVEEALVCCEAALAVKPQLAKARWLRAIYQLPVIAPDAGRVAAARSGFSRELAALSDWIGTTPPADCVAAVGAQPFYLAYQEENNRELLARYGMLCTRVMQHWQQAQGLVPRRRAGGGRVRLGIVSAHLKEHSVWRGNVKGWLQHLDRDRFEIDLFKLDRDHDQETALAAQGATMFELAGRDLRAAASTIVERAPDVLIYPEIGMEATALRLASMRLAAVQVASWGHPETTGLPSIDYYLSGEDLEPDDAQANYTERLVKLPRLGCCYEPLQTEPAAPDLASLGLDAGSPLLLCPGTPFKYAPHHDGVLVEIARKLERCHFLFFAHRSAAVTMALRRRLEGAFALAGMDFERYVIFIPWQPRHVFYGLMRRANLMLDTIGFSGFNTAMQAVEAGVPVVTHEGRFMRSRLASGVLQCMGLRELVAGSPQEFIDRAVKLASDRDYNERVRARLAADRNVLFGDVAPIRALEAFLCEAAGPGGMSVSRR